MGPCRSHTLQASSCNAATASQYSRNIKLCGSRHAVSWSVLAVSERPPTATFAFTTAVAIAFAIFAASSFWMRAWYVVAGGFRLDDHGGVHATAKEIIWSGSNSGQAFLVFWVPATLLFSSPCRI